MKEKPTVVEFPITFTDVQFESYEEGRRRKIDWFF